MIDVALALGGGGSKGYAHLGVIRALQKRGFRIKAIAGTSAGGIAGTIVAAGFSPDEIIGRIANIRQENLYGFGKGPALLGTKGIEQVIYQFLEDKTFSDLQIPCALTAVDLNKMKEIIIQEGKVIDGVMATTAIPGVFPPREWKEYLLVDGMVLNPVPVELARSLAPSLPVIAVSLTPEPERWTNSSLWNTTPANPLLRPISKLRVAKAFDIYLRSMDITIHMLGEKRLEIENPDILIRPDVGDIGSLDRVNIPEVAQLGDQAVEQVEDELRKISKRRRWYNRK
jgi:NTE family protein